MVCLINVSRVISTALQKLFYRIGWFTGRNPYTCIGVCLLVTFLLGFGITVLKEEHRGDKLWVSEDSPNQAYYRHIQENYKDPFTEELIITSHDILTPDSLSSMLLIDETVKSVNVGKSWDEICYRVGEFCYSSSILEVWGFNKRIINNLTREDILDKINALHVFSPLTSRNVDVLALLGGVQRGKNGDIISAEAAVVTYRLRKSDVDQDKTDTYVGDDVTKWETEFIDYIGKRNYGNLNVTLFASTSLDRESSDAIKNDIFLLAIGYCLLFVYIMAMLGQFSLIEHKIYVSLCGIFTVVMACTVAIGLCSILRIMYSATNSILPFLLLGVGVDDMFVIVQSWENLSLEERTRPVHEKSAIAMQNAGVSITVTSVTDMIVFAVGATTIFPGLRSFCLYCGVGIFFLFIFSILFFSSVLVLDERRVDSRHDACICCYRHRDDYEPPKCAKRQLLQEFFGKIYAPVLMKLSVKVFVVVITVIMFIFGTFGTLNIEQHFDFALFVAPDSYVNEFFDLRQKFFPERGSQSAIYLPNVRLFYEQAAIENLYLNARKDAFIAPLSVSSWYQSYAQWILVNKEDYDDFDKNVKWPKTEEIFFDWVSEFLNSTTGKRYANDVVFDRITSKYVSSRITFKHIVLDSSAEELDAVSSIQHIIDGAGFKYENGAFAFSKPYLYYETNRIIKKELWRNLGLASLCVLVVVLLLLANVNASLLVFFSVILTLVNVSGFMYFWDIKIDVIVTMLFILSVGIAVDYAAHIAHTFMTVTGTRNERTCHTMRNIGPAVFNGGFSTFLVVILMSLSNAYVYQVFFKVFLLVVVFSLFHGLVLLPVLLSWFGPSPLPQLNEEPTTGEVKAKGEECKEEREAGGVDNTAFEVEICTSKEDDHVDVVSNDDVDDITENAEVACKDELYIQCVEDGETKDDDSKQNADDALQIEEIKDRALFHKSEFAVECVDGVAYSNKVDDFEDGENGRSE